MCAIYVVCTRQVRVCVCVFMKRIRAKKKYLFIALFGRCQKSHIYRLFIVCKIIVVSMKMKGEKTNFFSCFDSALWCIEISAEQWKGQHKWLHDEWQRCQATHRRWQTKENIKRIIRVDSVADRLSHLHGILFSDVVGIFESSAVQTESGHGEKPRSESCASCP